MRIINGVQLQVKGYGRVGSYAKAKDNMRSRSHKYWAIAEWSNECSDYCISRQQTVGHHNVHYPVGLVEREDLGRFKTKKAAEEKLNSLQEV